MKGLEQEYPDIPLVGMRISTVVYPEGHSYQYLQVLDVVPVLFRVVTGVRNCLNVLWFQVEHIFLPSGVISVFCQEYFLIALL